jgi:hypothetical protein
MRSIKRGFLTLLSLLALVSCSRSPKPEISFYYWKTAFKLSGNERRVLRDNHVTRLYVRYFDVDFDRAKGTFPRAAIRFSEKPPKNCEIIPVVYIKNVVFSNDREVESLARRCIDYVRQINLANAIDIREIQIDCDWTLETRDRYLKFVEVVKSASGKRISATIRLHQIKYFEKTGYPRVDHAVLMYYNMGTIAADARNSIYDRDIARRYLPSLRNYPIAFDVALPVYTWAVHIRNARPIGLRRKESLASIVRDNQFSKIAGGYISTAPHYFHGVYFQKGDALKLEAISNKQLAEMAADLSLYLKNSPGEIIFYDFDEFNFQRYEANIFQQTAACF